MTIKCATVAGKYREFHKLYNNRQYTEAGALLLSLLTARVAPKRSFFTVMHSYRRVFIMSHSMFVFICALLSQNKK